MVKLNLSKEWLLKMAQLEEGHVVAAGLPYSGDPVEQHLRRVIERDRTECSEIISSIQGLLSQYHELGESDRTYDEEEIAIQGMNFYSGIRVAIRRLTVIAHDRSDCPVEQSEILEARRMKRTPLSVIRVVGEKQEKGDVEALPLSELD